MTLPERYDPDRPVTKLVGQMAAEAIEHGEIHRSEVIEKWLVDELIVDTEKVVVGGPARRGANGGEVKPVFDELRSASKLSIGHLQGGGSSSFQEGAADEGREVQMSERGQHLIHVTAKPPTLCKGKTNQKWTHETAKHSETAHAIDSYRIEQDQKSGPTKWVRGVADSS